VLPPEPAPEPAPSAPPEPTPPPPEPEPWAGTDDDADAFASKPDRRPLYAAAAALVLAAAAGGAWYTGKIGDRPGSVATDLNAELAAAGIKGIAVSLNSGWTATLTGEVIDPALRDRALALVQADKDVDAVADKILVRDLAAERLGAARATMLQ
jgi:hypothetical protein